MKGIVARDLRRSFPDGTVAVDGLSFTVEPGSITGFLGPNGAGKTTTIRLMVGLDIGQGATTFDGVPYDELDRPATHVGVVLGAGGFHPRRRAADHLRMVAAGIGAPAAAVSGALRAVGLDGAGDKRASTLSLGMRQRLAIAVALLGRPRVLILDEPCNGLDPGGALWLRAFLRDLADDGAAVFVSSHLLAEVQALADDLVVIDRGRAVAQCSVESFVSAFADRAVRLRTAEAEVMAALLSASGASVERVGHEVLRVRGLDQEAVAEAAHGAGVLLTELSPEQASLEDSYHEALRAGGIG